MEKKNKPVTVKKAAVIKEKKSVTSKAKTLKNSALEKVKNGAEKTGRIFLNIYYFMV